MTAPSNAIFAGECGQQPDGARRSEGHSGAPLRIAKYDASLRQAWNDFLSKTKNGTFLFHRDFLEYHADRFVDCSLMVYEGEHLVAMLPANLAGSTLVSHGGLTYGGMAVMKDASLDTIARSFRAIMAWASSQGHATLLYKRIPRIYRLLADDEIDYIQFLVGATLVRRDLSSTIEIDAHKLAYRKGRKSSIAIAVRRGCEIERTTDFAPFWNQVLRPTLNERHGVTPVHSVEEISLLAGRFPDNIKQFGVIHSGELVAGATMFVTNFVAHTQYLAATKNGRSLGALDFLIDHLLRNEFADKRYFDFGISNEQEGRVVNFGLHRWKEGFGARGVSHDFYEVETANYAAIDAAFGSSQGECQ